LSVPIRQVQDWISGGQLKVLDTFVTDRSFDEFCKKHGTEINLALIDPATAKWLIDEYGVPSPSTDCRTVGRALKHALVVRTCKCGREIAGNVYFKHKKNCSWATGDQAFLQDRLGIEFLRRFARTIGEILPCGRSEFVRCSRPCTFLGGCRLSGVPSDRQTLAG
jgi:hypothetical protein